MLSAGRKASAAALNESLAEMTDLAVAAGLRPLKKLKQNLRRADPSWLIGRGKRKELEESASLLKPDYVIFDHDLSGIQTRNLEKALNIHVLDRRQLILEIFAQRAQSREGKLQVELAQLLDQMPRMTGAWLGSLSRQGGGGAAKGPGEKALETDRRQARARIKRIKEKLEKVRSGRGQRRASRQRKKIPSFALVGYTNSGKSSLLNCLAKPGANSRAETKDQPFMTLDPKTRRFFIPGAPPQNSQAVVTDTVGFIKDLPPHLISAFKATLEESATADVILHVADIASPQRDMQIKVVDDLIERFGWGEKPLIYVFNKIDLLPLSETVLPARCQNRAAVSALTGRNMESLAKKMREALNNLKKASLKNPAEPELHNEV